MQNLFEEGHLTHTQLQKEKKLSLSRQAKLIQLMSNLLSNGFHIGEVTEFLSRSELMPEVFVEKKCAKDSQMVKPWLKY